MKKTVELKIDSSISTSEIASLNELIYKYYVNEMFINYSWKNRYYGDLYFNRIYSIIDSSPDEKFKSANSITNSSVRLYTKILFEILYNSLWTFKNSVSTINNFWIEYYNDLNLTRTIYLANPFMTLYNMVLFSGNNNTFVEDNLIAFNTFIPLSNLQRIWIIPKKTDIKVDDHFFPHIEKSNFDGIILDNRRLFNAFWIYICYIVLAILLIIFSGLIYQKRLYS